LPNKVPMHIRKERNSILRQLSQKKQHYFYEQNIGKTKYVLWEDTEKNGLMFGFTENYIRVSAPYQSDLTGKITPVVLKGWDDKKQSISVDILQDVKMINQYV